MLRYFFIGLGLFLVGLLAVAGFRGQKSGEPPIEIFPDMDHQPKVKAQVPSEFFADGRGNREPVPGTVPLGYASPLHKPIDGSTGESPHAGRLRYIRGYSYQGDWARRSAFCLQR